MKKRHFVLALVFTLWVVLPSAVATYYMHFVADDQYASYVGFNLRSEDVSPAIELLGGITQTSGSNATDTEILSKFIHGRAIVRAIDDQVGLTNIYHNPDDPVFSLPLDASIEDKEQYWQRVVRINFDGSSGLIELLIVAFDPQDAQNVARIILDESTQMINQLTDAARNDATEYARTELDRSIERLKQARQAMVSFRVRTQIIDPLIDTQGRMGLLQNLQNQLAETLIEAASIRETTREDDPRLLELDRRIRVIEAQIESERNIFGEPGSEDEANYSELIGEYEALNVDLEFAEKSYLSSLAAFDSAVIEAQRQSLYLATYQAPTLAEMAEFPRRTQTSVLIFLGLLGSFMIASLVFYAIRDR